MADSDEEGKIRIVPFNPSRGFSRHTELYERYLAEEGAWATKVRGAVNDALRNTSPNILWHYCPLSAFEGICKSGKLFMGPISTMNDYKEGHWLRDRIIDRLSPAARAFLPYLELTRIKFFLDPYIVSLSEQGDLLSQWRAYASGGKGVALGLSSSELEVPILRMVKEVTQGQTVLARVVYEEEVQETVIDQIAFIIYKIVEDLRGEEYKEEEHPFVPLSAYINMYLHHIAPIFKNPAFREEAEWRIIYYPKSHLVNSWEPDLSKLSLSDSNEAATLRFRFREDNIVPHFLFPKDRDIQSTINQIMLGPLCKMSLAPLSARLKTVMLWGERAFGA